MRKLLLIAALLTVTTTANAAVLCQSYSDLSFYAWFPGLNCPAGYIVIRWK